MKSIIFLIASILASPLYGQIKFSELPTKTAGSSTASQIFFPLVEMDGTPSVSRMSATELATLISGGGSTSAFSLTLLDDTSASAWRTTLGLGTAATTASTAYAAASHTHAGADITSGVIGVARLGTGTANNTTFLRGDGTWAAVPGVDPGSTLLATAINLNGGFVATNAPPINVVQIWNDSGTAFQGVKVDIQNSASAAGSRPLELLAGGVTKWSVALSGAQYQAEVASDPAAPAANTAVLFVRDNGSGKTQLCVRFPTGAIQVLSTEP